MGENSTVSFGDNVRVRDTSATRAAGVSGLVGQVHGWTTPSVTGIDVIGEMKEDFAVGVYFKELGNALFLVPDLLELIDHSPGMEVEVADTKWVRTEQGDWEELPTGTKHKDLLSRIFKKTIGKIFPQS